MNTSRSLINRLLDPEDEAITFKTLIKAANVLGKKLVVRLAEEDDFFRLVLFDQLCGDALDFALKGSSPFDPSVQLPQLQLNL